MPTPLAAVVPLKVQPLFNDILELHQWFSTICLERTWAVHLILIQGCPNNSFCPRKCPCSTLIPSLPLVNAWRLHSGSKQPTPMRQRTGMDWKGTSAQTIFLGVPNIPCSNASYVLKMAKEYGLAAIMKVAGFHFHTSLKFIPALSIDLQYFRYVATFSNV